MDRLPPKPPDGVMTRRHFLYVAGGVVAIAAAAPLLAACNAAATAVPGATSAPVTGGKCVAALPLTGTVGGALSLFEWEGYDGKGVPQWDAWYKANKIDLAVKYVTDQSNPTATMRSPGGQEYDVFSFNQGDVLNAWSDGDLLTPISIAEVPALAKMYPFFKDNELFHICDNQDIFPTVPWQWGPLGLIARDDDVPVKDLSSWQGLLEPKYKGRIITYDDPLNAVSQGACACSLDPAKLTKDQLNGPVRDFWKKLFPQLKAVVTSAGDQANLLASGDAWISMMGWAYNISQLTSMNVKSNFVIPDEGTYGFIDTIAIPPWAKNRRNAIAWANAMMEGDTAVALQESTIGMSTNPEVNAKVSGDVRSLFPADLESFFSKQLKFNRSWRDPNGQYATMADWTTFWNEIKTGA
jgi:putative spermidine/putrescine transport system substrate-binding protein